MAALSSTPAAILAALHTLGIGVREIADAAWMDPTHVSRIMRGKLGMSGLAPEVAEKLARGMEQLASRHSSQAAACRRGARAIRRTAKVPKPRAEE